MPENKEYLLSFCISSFNNVCSGAEPRRIISHVSSHHSLIIFRGIGPPSVRSKRVKVKTVACDLVGTLQRAQSVTDFIMIMNFSPVKIKMFHQTTLPVLLYSV